MNQKTIDTYKHIRIYIYVFLCLLLTTPALAAGIEDMRDGASMLNYIFGLDTSTLRSIAGNSDSAFSVVTKVLMSLAMLILSIRIALTTINGAIETGEDGAFLGKSYHSEWVPLRTVFSVIMLAPLGASGYSIMMGLVLWGNNVASSLADSAWNEVTARVIQSGSLRPVPPQGIEKLVADMYDNALCVATANSLPEEKDGPPVERIRVDTVREINPVDTALSAALSSPALFAFSSDYRAQQLYYRVGYKLSGTEASGLPESYCGTMMLAAESLPAEYAPVANQKLSATVAALNELIRLAYRDVDGQIGRKERDKEIYRITNDLWRRLGTVDANFIYKRSKQTQDRETADQISQAADTGWINAGIYTFTLARYTARAREVAKETMPSVSAPELDRGPDYLASDIERVLAAKSANRANMLSGMNGDPSQRALPEFSSRFSAKRCLSMTNPMDSLEACVSSFGIGILESLLHSTADAWDGDPVLAIQDMGHTLMVMAEASLALNAGIRAAAKGLKGANKGAIGKLTSWIPGLGGAKEAAIAAIEETVIYLTSLATVLIFIAFLSALFLALYLPFMTFIIWTMGVIQWVVSVILAVVVSVFLPVVNVTPDGNGWVTNEARQGMMLFASTMARPVLMVGALIVAILLTRVGYAFINQGFAWFLESSLSGQFAGPVVLSVMLLLYALLIVTLVRHTYGMIQIIPDQALAFVGNRLEPLGKIDVQNEIMTKFLGGVGTVGKAMKNARRKALGLPPEDDDDDSPGGMRGFW